MKDAIQEQLHRLRTALQSDPVNVHEADAACHAIAALVDKHELLKLQKSEAKPKHKAK